MSSTFWSGMNGAIVAGSATLATISWTMTKTARLAEVTNSGSDGVAQYIPGIKEYSGSGEVVWDSGAYPEAALEIGSIITLVMVMGNSTKLYSITAVIETLVPKVNTRTDAVTYSFTWKGTGALTNPE